VIVGRRCPDFSQCAFGDQPLCTHRLPERTADRAGVGAAIEDGSNDLSFAGTCIAVLADVAVEAERAVVMSLNQALAPSKK
jgi:hypothetical protein